MTSRQLTSATLRSHLRTAARMLLGMLAALCALAAGLPALVTTRRSRRTADASAPDADHAAVLAKMRSSGYSALTAAERDSIRVSSAPPTTH